MLDITSQYLTSTCLQMSNGWCQSETLCHGWNLLSHTGVTESTTLWVVYSKLNICMKSYICWGVIICIQITIIHESLVKVYHSLDNIHIWVSIQRWRRDNIKINFLLWVLWNIYFIYMKCWWYLEIWLCWCCHRDHKPQQHGTNRMVWLVKNLKTAAEILTHRK